MPLIDTTCRCLKNPFAVLALSVVLLGGCTTLEPYAYEEDVTPPPSTAAFWQEIDAARDGDWFALLNNGRDGLEWRLRAIDAAVERIDLQTFIWDFDAIGGLVRERLTAAADRGVEVRVLVDDSFLLHGNREWQSLDAHPRIEVKVFNPFRRRADNAALRQILNAGEFHRLDHRMHNKAMVVDARAVVIGGRNLAEHYFGFGELGNFRDFELLAFGGVAERVAAGFDRYWNNPWSFPVAVVFDEDGPSEQEALEPDPRDLRPFVDRLLAENSADAPLAVWREMARSAPSGSARLLLDRPPDDRPGEADEAPTQVGNTLLETIAAAESEVWLVSPYLIPTPALEGAVYAAERRGVRVRILTNSIQSNNHLTAHAAYRRHLRRLVEFGAEVHELRADAADRHRYIESPVEHKLLLLHAKLLVIDDDLSYVGSANLDPRSLRINTEMGLLVESERFNRELRNALESDFAPRNAWRVSMDPDDRLVWSAGDVRSRQPPDASPMLLLEDWFLSLLPIESEL